ncbi:MAG: TetR/AcrR family transcriptional regulator [Oscillospiraceae bacterium]|nr:TetR/AcrR family transcriptional regulator [Oscillospiraceae bacterium]
MPKDKSASHARVLAAAREEFLTYGFEKASMRRVGERCGLTAAGLYRHCRDKADLFDLLVAPAIRQLNTWMEDHLARYLTAVREDGALQWQDSWIDMMREVVYPNVEDYYLLLTCSSGTKYESFLHDLTQAAQERTLQYLPVLREKGLAVREISPSELHLLFSAYVTALFEPVIHRYPLDESMRCLETVEAFFLPGWKTLFGF